MLLNYNNAFERVKHDHVITKSKKNTQKDIRIIAKLYYNETALLMAEGHSTEPMKMEKGVKARVYSVTGTIQPLFGRNHENGIKR